MSEPVLRIEESSAIIAGKTYTLRFRVSGLNAQPVVYSADADLRNWRRVDGIARLGDEYGFSQKLPVSQQDGNIPLTFFLFERKKNYLWCWLANDSLPVAQNGGNIIVIDNSIKNVANEGGAVYAPIDKHNVPVNVNMRQAATPQSITFHRQDNDEVGYEKHLPIGDHCEQTAARWKLKFLDGKETVLLTTNPTTVGRSRKHDIFFKGSKDENTLLYSGVMSANHPLKIDVKKTHISFVHKSDRHITVNGDQIQKNVSVDSDWSIGEYSLLFEHFMPLNIKPAKNFQLTDWQVDSSVPQEVLHELLSKGNTPPVCPPLYFSTSEQHPLNETTLGHLEQFVQTANDTNHPNAKEFAASLEFFKKQSANHYAFRDYYFVGSGLQCTLLDNVDTIILPVSGHLYMLFPKHKAVCRIHGGEFDINAGQPVMLRNNLTITVNNQIFTTEHL